MGYKKLNHWNIVVLLLQFQILEHMASGLQLLQLHLRDPKLQSTG